MEKSEKVSRVKVIYFLLIAVLIAVAIVGDVIVFGKLDSNGSAGDIKGAMIVISMIIIAMAIIIGAAMFKFVADEERVSTVKSDKYKKLFLNLPVGFAQAQILRDTQSRRNTLLYFINSMLPHCSGKRNLILIIYIFFVLFNIRYKILRKNIRHLQISKNITAL